MNPSELARSIYLGDRSVKHMLIDGWGERVCIVIDLLSRIRSQSGNWEYYSDEDIVDGILVFSGVKYFSLDPPGYIPNDLIESFGIEREMNSDDYVVDMKVISANVQLGSKTVTIRMIASDFCIEDPNNPGVAISA